MNEHDSRCGHHSLHNACKRRQTHAEIDSYIDSCACYSRDGNAVDWVAIFIQTLQQNQNVADSLRRPLSTIDGQHMSET